MTKRVLFVCLGNICRSPTGEAVLRQFLAAQEISAEIESAGTIGVHAGEKADSRMRAAAASRGYSIDSLARQVTRRDLTSFDLIIAMDRQNFSDLMKLSGGADHNVGMLSDFLDGQQDWPRDVPDPYYGGDDGFEFVLDMIEAACPGIQQRLCQG